MRKKSFRIFLPIAAGVVFIALAAVLFLNKQENTDVPSYNTESIAAAIEDILPPKSAGIVEERYYKDMPMMSLDGKDFIGLLELTAYDIKLPVFAGWDEQTAKLLPCKYAGSIYDGTLVLGGADTNESFGFLTKINAGDEITFTDMTGKVFSSRAAAVRHTEKADFTYDGDGIVLFSYIDDISKYVVVECEMY